MSYTYNPLSGNLEKQTSAAALIAKSTVTGKTIAAAGTTTVASSEFPTRLNYAPLVIKVYDSNGVDLGFDPYAEANGDYYDIKIYNGGAEIANCTIKVF